MNPTAGIVPHPHAENKDAPSTRAIAPADVTGNVYLASSLATYHTPRYARMCNRAHTCFPKATILPARDLFTSNESWRAGWPAVLASCAALAFFADDAGWIGYGVWTEMHDAARAGLPIWYLSRTGAPHPLERLTFTVDEDDWRQYASVALTPVRVR